MPYTLKLRLMGDKKELLWFTNKILAAEAAAVVKINLWARTEPHELEVQVHADANELLKILETLPDLQLGVDIEHKVFVANILFGTNKLEETRSLSEVKKKLSEKR